jgi:hypothetical protein
MSLVDNIKILMPLAPVPADPGMQAISDALEVAMTTNIRATFVPGIGAVFMAALPNPNPFQIAMAVHLDTTVTPIISTALSVQATLGGPIPAWMSVQPSFDAIALIVPASMAGGLGVLFWQAVVLTIRLAILPPLPPPPGSGGTDSDGDGRIEVLEIET